MTEKIDGRSTPKVRALRALAMKKRWGDPAFRERMRAIASARLKKQWQDPAFRALHVPIDEHMRSNPKLQEKRRESRKKHMKENWADPEFRQKQAVASRKSMLARWDKGEFLSGRLAIPEEFLKRYNYLVKKVGAKDARVAITEEMEKAKKAKSPK